MSQKTTGIIGWALTALLAASLAMSAFMKLTQSEVALQQAASFGITPDVYRLIGLVELVSLILFLIPRTSVAGTLLLAAYLGGAIASHLQHQQPILPAVLFQVVLWLAAFLRLPEFKQRLLSAKTVS